MVSNQNQFEDAVFTVC